MSNKNFYENELIIEERSHSYEFYKKKVSDIFDKYKSKMNERRSSSDSHSYDFVNAFRRVYDNTDEKSKGYNTSRIMLFKNLNLLNSITEKLCNYNIDSSILSSGFNIQSAGNAFIWFMCDANNYASKDAQDINRIKAFKKLMYELEKITSIAFFDNKDLDNFREKMERKKINEKEFDEYKSNLKYLLKDTFFVYECLSKYCSYLPDYFVSGGVMSGEETKNNDFDKDDFDKESIYKAYMLSAAVKKVYIELLCGFSKIPELNLGNSNFDYACFSRSNLTGSNFINSTFVRAQFDNAILSDCDFSICDFSRANAKEATLNNCTFNYADMKGLNLTNATLNNSNFDSVLFRDYRVDNNKAFAQEVTEYLKSDTDKETARVLIDKLTTEDINLDEMFSDLYSRLGKDKQNSIENSLWSLTIVDSEKQINDYEVRIGCYAEDTKSKTTASPEATRFDDVFKEISRLLDKVKAVCTSKVIGGKLLDYMYQAEKDNYEYVKPIEERHENICLERTVLSGATIKDSSLHQIDLSNINFENASFENSDLSECIAYYCLGKTSSFANAVLGMSEFFACELDDTGFVNANCIGTKFIDCSMNNINMESAIAIGAKFINTNRTEPFIKYLLRRVGEIHENIDDTLEFTDEKINLVESNWSNASLSKAMFVGYLMDRSHFRNTDIRSSLIFDCVLRWSVFNDCDASYALMIGNCFHQANFTNANLSQSHIFASEFSGCQMINANLIGARCDRTIFFDNDLTNANFSHCWFQNCVFRDCDFTNVNMSNVDFNRCVFINVSFETCKGMIQNSAVFTNCTFPDNFKREKEEGGLNLEISSGFSKRTTQNTIIIKKATEINGSNPFRLVSTNDNVKNRKNIAYDVYSTSWQ